MHEPVRRDFVADVPRWVIQAIRAASRNLALSGAGLATSLRLGKSARGLKAGHASAPGLAAGPRPTAMPHMPSSGEAAPIEATLLARGGNISAQSRTSDQTVRSFDPPQTRQAELGARSEATRPFPMPHQPRNTATMQNLESRSAQAAEAGSGVRATVSGADNPLRGTNLNRQPGISYSGTSPRVSVTMGPPARRAVKQPDAPQSAAPGRVQGLLPGNGSAPAQMDVPISSVQDRPAQAWSPSAHVLLNPLQTDRSSANVWKSNAPVSSARDGQAQVASRSGQAAGADAADASGTTQRAVEPLSIPSQGQDGASRPALSGPTEGDVYLDGTLVGRWMARSLAQAAARQPSGSAAFDATRSRLPAGAMIGV